MNGFVKKKNRQTWPVVSTAFSSEWDSESSPDPRPDPDSKKGSDFELSDSDSVSLVLSPERGVVVFVAVLLSILSATDIIEKLIFDSITPISCL